MAKRVQLIRHATTAANAFTGKDGEITVDLTAKELRLHDAVTAGGFATARKDMNNVAAATNAKDGKMSAAKIVELEAATSSAAANAVLIALRSLITDEGAANGIATLNASSRVVQLLASQTVTIAQINSLVGRQTIPVRATAMEVTATNGAAVLTKIEVAAGRPEVVGVPFPYHATQDYHAVFAIPMPKQWNKGTITFQPIWTSAATDTDGVAWGLQAVALSDGDSLNTAYGTPQVVTDVAQSNAYDELLAPESSALTIAGAPATGDTVYFAIFRDASDGANTMTEDAILTGLNIFYTNILANDA